MAKQALMATYKLSEEQAKAILDMKLQRLANLEAIKVNNEFDENAVEIERLGNILSSQDEINKILIAALREVATKFGDGRRTQLMNLSEQVEEVEEEEVILSVTNNSSIKVVKRGAKDAIRTTNFGTLVCVTSEGKMYKIPVANILECGSAKIATLIKDNASIVYIGDLSEIKINKYWAFITANGMAKKSAIEEYNYSGRQGGKMLKLKEGDSVIACGIYTSDTETISHNGKGVTLSVLSVTGKSAMGSKVFKE